MSKDLIIFLRSTGMPANKIAEHLGVSPNLIYKILKDIAVQGYKNKPANAMYNTDAYKEFRKEVLKEGKCRECSSVGSKYNPLQVEHIKPKALFPELMFERSNVKILCLKCHRKTPTFGRNKLRKYAKKIAKS